MKSFTFSAGVIYSSALTAAAGPMPRRKHTLGKKGSYDAHLSPRSALLRSGIVRFICLGSFRVGAHRGIIGR
jgi:hypothetical protein